MIIATHETRSKAKPAPRKEINVIWMNQTVKY